MYKKKNTEYKHKICEAQLPSIMNRKLFIDFET